MLAEGDPIALAMYEQYKVIMPNFRLDRNEIEALIDYMANESERLRRRYLAADDHSKHLQNDPTASGHVGH